MTRSLTVLTAIAVASVAGVWIQSVTRDGSRRATPQESTAVIEATEIARGPVAAGHTVPAPDTRASARLATATAGSRPHPVPRNAEPEHAAPTTANASAMAMRVALDPVTRQIVTPEHTGLPLTIQEMQDIARQEAEGLVTIRNADGSETLNHEGRFADFNVIRVGPDGKPVFMCVHGRPGVEHALRQPAPATPSMEDR
jgi:hypothetical protein